MWCLIPIFTFGPKRPFPLAGDQTHMATEQTAVPLPRVRTEGQQVNGIMEDRSSVSSTDMLVRQRHVSPQNIPRSSTGVAKLAFARLPLSADHALPV